MNYSTQTCGPAHRDSRYGAGIGVDDDPSAVTPAGVPFAGALRRGDRLVRMAPSGGILHSAVVMSESAEDRIDLIRRGIPVEVAGPGRYVEVLEIPFGGGLPRAAGRRLTDSWGRLPPGQMLVRTREPSDPIVAGPYAERAFSDDSPSPAEPAAGNIFHLRNARGVVLVEHVRREVASRAEHELRRWRTTGGSRIDESDPQGRMILQTDYWPAAGVPDATAAFGEDWSDRAWSAAFVSFTVNTTANRLSLANLLRGSASHMRYVWQAYQDRIAQRVERYWAYSSDQVTVEVGDIVVKARGTGSPATWNDVTSSTFQLKLTHGDIVVATTGTTAIVIGGNVDNTVNRRSYPLSVGTIERNSAANGANRVFAVLKPVGRASASPPDVATLSPTSRSA